MLAPEGCKMNGMYLHDGEYLHRFLRMVRGLLSRAVGIAVDRRVLGRSISVIGVHIVRLVDC